ncbi:hypothetical protein O5400_06385 (plasmid) [Borrelia miyamotoi]|nr:hypothetical protein [Borrelia miyamotoi]WAZ85972.1 hypothetical protein O5400_06385 [Borrelia miyamotoi]WAZ95604.1 hypothetical protein O5397_06280 [Borrelia miyamotoi]
MRYILVQTEDLSSDLHLEVNSEPLIRFMYLDYSKAHDLELDSNQYKLLI